MKVWLNFYRFAFIFLFMMIFICNSILANIPKLKSPVEITGIQIIQSNPKTGKLILEISFEEKLNISGTLRINTYNGVKLWQNSQKMNEIQERLELFKSRIVRRNFVL